MYRHCTESYKLVTRMMHSTMSATSQKYLIIVCDDFGYSVERDAGIVQCYEDGAISAVSVMMNGHSVHTAVKLATDIAMPMDLHVNLSDGRPVSNGSCSTYTDPNGLMLGKMGLRKAAQDGKIDLGQIKVEMQAQIDRFQELTGHKPVKVDGHQHVHVIPGICELFLEVLSDNGIHITRLPIEGNINSHTWSSRQQMEFMEGVVQQSKQAQGLLTRNGIWAPGFVGLKTMGQDMTIPHLQSCITEAYKGHSGHVAAGNNACSTPVTSNTGNISSQGADLPNTADMFCTTGNPSSAEKICLADDNVCELMVHPGNITMDAGGCGHGPDMFSQSPDREHEMRVLRSEEMLTYYRNSNISLVSFRDIWKWKQSPF